MFTPKRRLGVQGHTPNFFASAFSASFRAFFASTSEAPAFFALVNARLPDAAILFSLLMWYAFRGPRRPPRPEDSPVIP